MRSRPFRQYVVLPCSPLFGTHSNFSSLPGKPVLLRSQVFLLISAETVAWHRGFGGRF